MRRSERLHVGSIPASAASRTEVLRPDEEPVLKTGGGEQPLVGSSPTASALGSWSNRTTPAPHAGNLGAIPSDSTFAVPWSSGEDAWPTSRKPMVRVHPGPLDGPGTPIGRAAWLKPGRLRVRLRPWARPGRQMEDHLGLDPPDAVGSRPTWANIRQSPSRSSVECSPVCRTGDHGFKSRRGR